MDRPLSAPPLELDKSDELQTPFRSPSRLDFCMEGLDDGGSSLGTRGDSEMHDISWACNPFCDNRPYTPVPDEAIAVDVAPLDRSRHFIVEGGGDGPPQPTNSRSHENSDASHSSMSREHPMVVIEPQSPIPVRPFSIQFQSNALDVQERIPPSRNTSQRLNYPHHGLSRSALLQQKSLWNSRHEEWAGWQSRTEQDERQRRESETNDAYTGLATTRSRITKNPPPYMRTPPSGLERDLTDNSPRKSEQDVHAPIFPRVGDISALRDPYSVNIDRCFFKFPLWTLQKMLYMFDMHRRSASLAASTSVCDSEHIGASLSTSTSSYTLSVSGDDGESDSTLVADHNLIHIYKHPLEPLKCTLSPRNLDHLCGWELSWYAKWELLIDLFRRDHSKCDILDLSMKLVVPNESKTAALSPPEPIFRFTVEGAKENYDDDEDEDYGMVISDPTFGVDFDEECERAMAFYGRESTLCSEMAF